MYSTEEIYAQMMGSFSEKTGMELRDSCDLAVRMYAVATQIEGLYHQANWAVTQCFPQTAQGKHLEYHAQMRGLERKQAEHATGVLRFFGTEGQTVSRIIPIGSVAMTAGLIRFETIKEGVLTPDCLYADIPARAVAPGETGNISSLAVVAMSDAPVGIEKCSNIDSFGGGMEMEDDTLLRQRIMDSLRRLPNGANVAYYEQEALSYEGVAAVRVLPRHRGIGTVDIVVTDADGLATQGLLDELSAYFELRREIATDVVVRNPSTISVDVSVELSVAIGHSVDDVKQRVNAHLTSWFDGTRLGKPVLQVELSSLVFTCLGVENCKILSPTVDIVGAIDCLPVLGTLVVEALV